MSSDLWPEIAPPEVRKERAPTVEDLLPIVVEDGLGLRPHRKDGIRLEVEWVEAHGAKAPVVFHYGCIFSQIMLVFTDVSSFIPGTALMGSNLRGGLLPWLWNLWRMRLRTSRTGYL